MAEIINLLFEISFVEFVLFTGLLIIFTAILLFFLYYLWRVYMYFVVYKNHKPPQRPCVVKIDKNEESCVYESINIKFGLFKDTEEKYLRVKLKSKNGVADTAGLKADGTNLSLAEYENGEHVYIEIWR